MLLLSTKQFFIKTRQLLPKSSTVKKIERNVVSYTFYFKLLLLD